MASSLPKSLYILFPASKYIPTHFCSISLRETSLVFNSTSTLSPFELHEKAFVLGLIKVYSEGTDVSWSSTFPSSLELKTPETLFSYTFRTTNEYSLSSKVPI